MAYFIGQTCLSHSRHGLYRADLKGQNSLLSIRKGDKEWKTNEEVYKVVKALKKIGNNFHVIHILFGCKDKTSQLITLVLVTCTKGECLTLRVSSRRSVFGHVVNNFYIGEKKPINCIQKLLVKSITQQRTPTTIKIQPRFQILSSQNLP